MKKLSLLSALILLCFLSHAQSISWDTYTFWESGENNGRIQNEIIGTYDPYAGPKGNGAPKKPTASMLSEGLDYMMYNKPAGLDVKVMWVQAGYDTRIRIRIRENATNHEDINDEPQFKIEFLDRVFSGSGHTAATVQNSDPTFTVNFYGEATPPLDTWNNPTLSLAQSPFAVAEFYCTTSCSSCWYWTDWNTLVTEQEQSGKNVLLMTENYLEWSEQDEWFLDDQGFHSFTDRYHNYLDNTTGNWAYDLIAYNGKYHTGYNRGDNNYVKSKMDEHLLEQASAGISISLHELDEAKGKMVVNYEVSGTYQGKQLQIVIVESDLWTWVRDGESFEMDGVNYLHTNVVRSFQTVVLPSDNSGRYTFYAPQNINYQNAKVMAFVQDQSTLEILGGTTGFNFQTLGTTEREIPNVSVYPNPATDQITINLADTQEANIKLFDASGKLVKEENPTSVKHVFETGNFDRGSYFLEISIGNKISLQKIVLE